MRSPITCFAAACLLIKTAAAVFADDAWNLDYHLALLGTPQEHTTFFHQPQAASKASLLYTLSSKGVLGAVNPRDGNIVWRQDLHAPSNATFLRAGEGQDLIISAIDGELTGWVGADGRQAWTVDLGTELVKDLEIIELQDGKEASVGKDIIVLSQGTTPILRRVDGATGTVKWEFKDESGDTPYQVSASATQVFSIALHSNLIGSGAKVRVTSLDPINGHKTDQFTLSSDSELSSFSEILSVGANSASPIIAWTDKAASVLKVNIIGTKSISSFDIPRVSGQVIDKVTLHAPYHTNARPHFLVHYQTAEQHWAEVYHVDLKASTVSKAYSLPKLAGPGAFSTSSSDANVYFTRISEAEVSVVSSASHGILARWPLKTLAGSTLAGGVAPVHAVSEISVKGDSVSAARSAVLLSSGDWILIRDGTASWQRPEALAGTLTAVWAYPQVQASIARELEVEAHSTFVHAYIHRVTRHLHDLHALPAYLGGLPNKLMKSVGLGSSPNNGSLVQSNFGYSKVVICATEDGRLIALDVGNNANIVWNVRPLAVEAGKTWTSPRLVARPDGKILVIDTAGGPTIVIDGSTGRHVAVDEALLDIDTVPAESLSYHREGNKVVGLSSKSSPAAPAWQFNPAADETITHITPRPAEDPVASIGKVLGDRRVLYKYLNPNTMLITTTSSKRKTASVSLIDTISGSVVFSARHNDVDLGMPIASTLSENWFAYSLTIHSSDVASKGYQLVIGELFESSLPDDRGMSALGHNSSDIGLDYQPYVMVQTYSIPEPISHMEVTQTGQGITSRQLLAVLPNSDSVVGIPRTFIDPRRPVGRDPTSLEASEGLMRYAPMLEFDAKWYLNHQRDVLGVKKITASPALLESTSLVFAYGLDIFGTRVSPSFTFDVLGKDFNKLQMMATVAALLVGTLIVAPLVSSSFTGVLRLLLTCNRSRGSRLMHVGNSNRDRHRYATIVNDCAAWYIVHRHVNNAKCTLPPWYGSTSYGFAGSIRVRRASS